MSPITHFLMGWAVANATPSLTKRERAFVTWASVVPDIDGLGIIAEGLTRNSNHPLNWWSDYHHVLGHNLGFALVVSVVAMIFARQRIKTTLLVLLSFHLHLLADLVGARGPDGDQWPIPYLLPFSRQLQLTWSGQWALNAWPNLIITAALIVIAVAAGSPARILSVGTVFTESRFRFCWRVASTFSFEGGKLSFSRTWIVVTSKRINSLESRHDVISAGGNGTLSTNAANHSAWKRRLI